MSYSKEELARYRMERAKESIEEARVMSETGHWNSTANRLYYACFYSASAYLVFNGLEAGTHNGVKSAFNDELIRSGKLPPELGRLYNKLFKLRQDADYMDYKDVSEQQVNPMITEVEVLVRYIEEMLVL